MAFVHVVFGSQAINPTPRLAAAAIVFIPSSSYPPHHSKPTYPAARPICHQSCPFLSPKAFTYRGLLKHLGRHLGQEARHALSLDDPEMPRVLQSSCQRSRHLHCPEVSFLTRKLECQTHLALGGIHRGQPDVRARLVKLDPPTEQRVDRFEELFRLCAEDLIISRVSLGKR